MGAWDVTPFGNDDASDMVSDLLEHPNPRDYLAQVLAHAKETGYLEAPEGSQMVAAAAIVAAAKNKESVSVPGSAASWIDANESMLRPLAATALEAVTRVRGENSELHELWQESDEFPAWIANLDRVSAALR
ncbi:MAG: DUF4259 domain-containing protein [Candidatus Acidiferrales bacterium]